MIKPVCIADCYLAGWQDMVSNHSLWNGSVTLELEQVALFGRFAPPPPPPPPINIISHSFDFINSHSQLNTNRFYSTLAPPPPPLPPQLYSNHSKPSWKLGTCVGGCKQYAPTKLGGGGGGHKRKLSQFAYNVNVSWIMRVYQFDLYLFPRRLFFKVIEIKNDFKLALMTKYYGYENKYR